MSDKIKTDTEQAASSAVETVVMRGADLELKKVTATTTLSVDAHCPNCNSYDDYRLQIDDIGDSIWGADDLDCYVECPNCEHEFIIDSIEY